MIIEGMKAVEQKDCWFNNTLLRPSTSTSTWPNFPPSRQNIGPLLAHARARLELAPSAAIYFREILQSRQRQPPPTAFPPYPNHLRLKQLPQSSRPFSAVINCSHDSHSCYWELARPILRSTHNPPLGGHISRHRAGRVLSAIEVTMLAALHVRSTRRALVTPAICGR